MYTIRTFQPADAPALAALQHRSLQVCPDMDPVPAGFFLNPGFQDGQNIFCAVDEQNTIRAYGLIFNSGERCYIDIKAGDPTIKPALLARIIERAKTLGTSLIYGCYFEDGRQSIDYLKASGFTVMDDETGLALHLDLRTATIPDAPKPEHLDIRPWPMQTGEERNRYITAHNQVLTMSPLTEERLAFLQGASFTCVAAFDGEAIAGSAIAFIKQNREASLEYLFVMPQYQRRGIARYLVAEVLRLLKERSAAFVQVETHLDNQAAIALYEWAGFRRAKREIMLGMPIQEATA